MLNGARFNSIIATVVISTLMITAFLLGQEKQVQFRVRVMSIAFHAYQMSQVPGGPTR